METNLPAVPWEGFKKLPDKGVINYVRDVLDNLGVDVDMIEKKHPHWMPVGIVGTLDWVMICGWWIWRNTGFFDSDEGYKYVIEFNGYEFDPDMIVVFREQRERNKYHTRSTQPGIEDIERTEALQFLMEDVYGGWAKTEGVDPKEFTPPQEFVELLMWATFMWVLSEYGRDWIYMQDEILACVIEYGAAFLEKWSGDKTLLDPREVVVTERPINSCRYCGETLWCVRGAFVNGDQWHFTCINCLVDLWEKGVQVDVKDERIIHPKCPHREGIEGAVKSCAASCPHSGIYQEKLWEEAQKKGSERLEKYREGVRMAGSNHRQLAGQSVDDIINHFK